MDTHRHEEALAYLDKQIAAVAIRERNTLRHCSDVDILIALQRREEARELVEHLIDENDYWGDRIGYPLKKRVIMALSGVAVMRGGLGSVTRPSGPTPYSPICGWIF